MHREARQVLSGRDDMKDILQFFSEKLREAGLAVEHVKADGLPHKCGTPEEPNEMKGVYIAYVGRFPTLTWKNWQTGKNGSWRSEHGEIPTENLIVDG